MTEEEAIAWVGARCDVSRETLLTKFAELVVAENEHQNLIAPGTVATIWSRHIVDSAQLVTLDPGGSGLWIDVGSGAGFPGMVTAILSGRPTILVEPRKKRADFLAHVIEQLKLPNVEVRQARVETVSGEQAATISARAVSGAPELLRAAKHLSHSATRWLLPKGKNAQAEVDALRIAWHGRFQVEHSITQSDSAIIVATGVGAR